MPGFLAGVATSIAGSAGQGLLGAISGLFGGRSKRKEAKAQREHEERQNRLSFESTKYLSDMERKRQLEDRRYKEDGIRGYGKFYRGSKTIAAPTMTDPNTVKPVDPYATVRR